VINSYLSRCTDATRMLRLSLPPADLRNLVLTDTYWVASKPAGVLMPWGSIIDTAAMIAPPSDTSSIIAG
jgi:hypothetical protein